MITAIFIDGDFPVKGSECKHYCSPTCHPGQIGPDWQYGCSHPAWPSNKYGDFCPIGMTCGGEIRKCEIPEKLLKRLINGKQLRIKNANTKISKWCDEISEAMLLMSRRNQHQASQSLLRGEMPE